MMLTINMAFVMFPPYLLKLYDQRLRNSTLLFVYLSFLLS